MPPNPPSHPSPVLIITRDFLPYCFSLGGSIRILKLAEYLRDNGIDVHVLCARGEEIGYFGYEGLVKSLDVIYLKDRLQPLVNRITRDSAESALRKMDRSSGAFRLLKKAVNELSIPDVGVFFVGKFIREASRMVREQGIRNVIVTSPPPSTLLAGYALKRRFGGRVNLLVDYRDSWNLGYVGRKRTLLADRLNLAMERRVLDAADHFLHVSAPMLDALATRVNGLAAKATLVMNGYDENQRLGEPLPLRRRTGSASDTSAGSVGSEPHRNPERLFAALEKCPGLVRLVLYGDVSVPDPWRERLKDVVEFAGVVPHEDALRKMQEMDLLLLYHSEREGAKEVVTGKLFEYMLAGRPILAMGAAEMEAADDRNPESGSGTRWTSSTRRPSMPSCGGSTRSGRKGTGPVRLGNLKRYSRQHQYSMILPLLV